MRQEETIGVLIMRKNLLLCCTVVLGWSCVRGGFSPQDLVQQDGSLKPLEGGVGKDLALSDRTDPKLEHLELEGTVSPGAGVINSDFDSCQTPYLLDFSALSTTPQGFVIDTTGATADYPHGCCTSQDLFLLVDHSPGANLNWSCSGSGSLNLSYNSTAGSACPPVSSYCFNVVCDGGNSSLPLPAGKVLIQICRTPSAVAPTLYLSLESS
jgi:hypothetical protein